MSVLSSLKVQKEQLSTLRDIFFTLDKNQDGYLDLKELADGFKSLSGVDIREECQTVDHECYEKILEQLDVNGDKKLDYIEFL